MSKLMMSLCALVLAGAATPAAAADAGQAKNREAPSRLVYAQDPQTLVAALQAGGYEAKLGKDRAGDPMITSKASGTTYQLFFYNCTNNRDCATIQFHSGYDMRTKPTLESMNAWNKGKRFARGFLDAEGDPIVEMDVDLDDGGLSRELFIDNVEFWATLVREFETHIGFRK